MEMEIDYRQKYLKYKAKYLELKKQMGGWKGPCTECNCKMFTNNTQKKYTNVKVSFELPCQTKGCVHTYGMHKLK